MSERSFDILKVHGFKFPDTARVIDLSQDITRCKSNANMCNIVTPDAAIYLGHRCRLLHGLESFALQGIHYGGRNHLLRSYDSTFLQNMSGNAFMSLCFAAVLTVKEVLLSRCSCERQLALLRHEGLHSSRVLHVDRSAICDDEDDDELLVFS